jgi:hypothetical protein
MVPLAAPITEASDNAVPIPAPTQQKCSSKAVLQQSPTGRGSPLPPWQHFGSQQSTQQAEQVVALTAVMQAH